jgi:2-polyprenyl-3-methyl-5-hydroxy-6-metoxy-1,4-benzoquinol methylase
MIHLNKRRYPYLEEVNEGVVREFRRLLPWAGRALDVGCGRGQLGAAVRSLGWEVWGVEQAGEACAAAEKRLHHLIRADLHDRQRVRAEVGDTRFEALLFSDVLEHVYDPLGALESYLDLLAPGGRLFVSVPNMVVWTNRLLLLLGRVRYSDGGVMDRTHIRFFNRRTARELVAATGCRVERVASTPHLVRSALPLIKRLWLGRGHPADPRALIDSRGYTFYLKYVYPVERWLASLWPALFAFRIIVVGRKPAEGVRG